MKVWISGHVMMRNGETVTLTVDGDPNGESSFDAMPSMWLAAARVLEGHAESADRAQPAP